MSATSPNDKYFIMGILQSRDPDFYKEINVRDKEIRILEVLTKTLDQMLSDHTEIPSLNKEIRNKLKAIRKAPGYDDNEDWFKSLVDELKVVNFNSVSAIEYRKMHLGQLLRQQRSLNEYKLDRSRTIFGSQMASERV